MRDLSQCFCKKKIYQNRATTTFLCLESIRVCAYQENIRMMRIKI